MHLGFWSPTLLFCLKTNVLRLSTHLSWSEPLLSLWLRSDTRVRSQGHLFRQSGMWMFVGVQTGIWNPWARSHLWTCDSGGPVPMSPNDHAPWLPGLRDFPSVKWLSMHGGTHKTWWCGGCIALAALSLRSGWRRLQTTKSLYPLADLQKCSKSLVCKGSKLRAPAGVVRRDRHLPISGLHTYRSCGYWIHPRDFKCAHTDVDHLDHTYWWMRIRTHWFKISFCK